MANHPLGTDKSEKIKKQPCLSARFFDFLHRDFEVFGELRNFFFVFSWRESTFSGYRG